MQTRVKTKNNALPVGYQLGEYTIKSVLGQGGFGITYLAQDTHLGSLVAIKEYYPEDYAERGANSTIYPRPDGNASDAEIYSWGLQEFLKEAQALARFKHNYIVRVLRYLEANGTAYMIMEYEEGESLSKYMKQHGGFLSEPDLLRVFLPILTGLQAVHEAGLLHLDIKPDNIYLRRSGHPMLIDFGSARQRQGKADSGRIALTRGYSALEQYPGNGGVMGPGTDVYSVGATLYRCVTGREPVDSLERHKTIGLGKIDPMPPATRFDRPLYAPHIRQCVDLALRLQAADRPASALALQNGLMGKEAKEEKTTPMSVLGHGSGFIGISNAIMKPLRKLQRRGFLESTFLFLLALTAMAIASVKIMIDTGRLDETELYTYFDQIRALPYDAGREINRFINAQLGINPVVMAPVSPALHQRLTRPKPVPEKPIPVFDPAKSVALTLAAHAPVTALAFVRDDQVLAAAYDDGTVNLWNTETGALISTMASSKESLGTMAASPDGQWLAFSVDPNAVQIWDAKENKAVAKLSGHTAPVMRLAFSADGKQLVSVDRDSGVFLWDIAESKKIFDLPKPRHEILALAVAHNGRVLAGADIEGGIQYWDLEGGRELAYVPAHKVPVSTIAYSPDGKWLASGGQDHNLKLWDAGLGRDDRVLAGAPDDVNTVQFSPDSRWLLLGGTNKSLEIWSVEQGQPVHRLAGHDLGVSVLTISSDGARLATSGDDGKILIWK
ncbi:MAG: serine/threonine-protein kinase [Sulfuricaulis sp.]|uniref:protein kinase domain-containing protein n=1 Tax=Sulfuricaulis sp. TaxID=2003553 RepID=UPI003C467FDA